MALPSNDAQFLQRARQLGIPLDPEGLGRYAARYGVGTGQAVSYAPSVRFGIIREVVLRRLESEGTETGSSESQRSEAEQNKLSRNVGVRGRSVSSYYREYNANLATNLASGVDLSDAQIAAAGARGEVVKARYQAEQIQTQSRREAGEKVISQEKQMLKEGFVRRDVIFDTSGAFTLQYFPSEYGSLNYSPAPVNEPKLNYSPLDSGGFTSESTTRTTTDTGIKQDIFEQLRQYANIPVSDKELPGFFSRTQANLGKAGISFILDIGTIAKEYPRYLGSTGARFFERLSGKQLKTGTGVSVKADFQRTKNEVSFLVGAPVTTLLTFPSRAKDTLIYGNPVEKGKIVLELIPNLQILGDAGKVARAGTRLGSRGLYGLGKLTEEAATRRIPYALEQADLFGGKPIYSSQRMRPTVKIKHEPLAGQSLPSRAVIPKLDQPIFIGGNPKMSLSAQSAYESFYKNAEKQGLKKIPFEPPVFDFEKLSGFALKEGMLKSEITRPQRVFSATEIFKKKEKVEVPNPTGLETVKQEPFRMAVPEGQSTLDRAFFGEKKVSADDWTQMHSREGLEFYELDYLNNRPLGYTKNILSRNKGTLTRVGVGVAGTGIATLIDPLLGKKFAATYLGAEGIAEFEAFKPKKGGYAKPVSPEFDRLIPPNARPRGPRSRIRDEFDNPESYYPARKPGTGDIYDVYNELLKGERTGRRVIPDMAIRYLPRVGLKTDSKTKERDLTRIGAITLQRTGTLWRTRTESGTLQKTGTRTDTPTIQATPQRFKAPRIFPPLFPPTGGPGRPREGPPREPTPEIPNYPTPKGGDDYFFKKTTRKAKRAGKTNRGFRYAPDVTSYITGFTSKRKRGAFSIGELRPQNEPFRRKRGGK